MERIYVERGVVERIGPWTADREIDVCGRHGAAVIDLRSARFDSGDIEVRLTLDHVMIKLLVPDGAAVDTRDLHWTGRGRVKDWIGVVGLVGRRVRLVGSAKNSEIRIHRGGIAMLSALFSRAFVDDCIHAFRDGTTPTAIDPSASR